MKEQRARGASPQPSPELRMPSQKIESQQVGRDERAYTIDEPSRFDESVGVACHLRQS